MKNSENNKYEYELEDKILELISLNDTDKWLNILEENKCFMKKNKEENIKPLCNLFKKVKEIKILQEKNLKENLNKKNNNDIFNKDKG
jgi:hypothetical protein